MAIQWNKISKSQTESNGLRFVIWQGAIDGFRLIDRREQQKYGPFSKLEAAKQKAEELEAADLQPQPRQRSTEAKS